MTSKRVARTKTGFDAAAIRKDFPCLQQSVNGQPLVFLDTAASAQKPQAVIDTLNEVYTKQYANIHRGIYYLSEIATRRFEETRHKVAKFINAASEKEIIFTRGATEAVNLVANSYGRTFIGKGDEIIISAMEHHANLVPWQQLCLQVGAILRIAPINDQGELDLDAFEQCLNKRTKFVAMTYMSNALGTITPIRQIIRMAHNAGAKVLVDACQAIAHLDIDVQELDCDFLVFSGHKLYGPNGTGALYGKYALLESMPPYQTGGEMITTVTYEKSEFQAPPFRFEAGTPVIAEVIALGSALDYLDTIDRKAAHIHEQELLSYATAEVQKLEGYTIIGTAKEKGSILSLIHKVAHPHDIGAILDRCGVAVRSGHHCAQPLMQRLKVSATARASFGVYSTKDDVDALVEGLKKVQKLFR